MEEIEIASKVCLHDVLEEHCPLSSLVPGWTGSPRRKPALDFPFFDLERQFSIFNVQPDPIARLHCRQWAAERGFR